MIKLVGETDTLLIAQICDVAHQFIEESDRPVTYSFENAYAYYMSFVRAPDAEVMVWEEEGVVKGGAIVAACNEAHVEKFGYLVKFYVRPEYRQSRVALKLMKAVNEYFDRHGCVQCFSTATAGVKKDEAFIKLCEKFGYKQETPILIREVKNG